MACSKKICQTTILGHTGLKNNDNDVYYRDNL